MPKFNEPIGNTQSLAATLLLLGALFIAASSLGFEHIGGYEPCRLCLIQRKVHYLMIPGSLILIAVIWRNMPAWFVRLGFVVAIALLAYGAGVGVYQAGAEWEWWLGPNCVPSKSITNDVTNLLAQMETTKLVSCTVAQLRILGLSFGGWNVVLSTALILIAAAGAFLPKDAFNPILARLPFIGGWLQTLHKA